MREVDLILGVGNIALDKLTELRDEYIEKLLGGLDHSSYLRMVGVIQGLELATEVVKASMKQLLTVEGLMDDGTTLIPE